MSKNWFISDLHHGHARVLTFENYARAKSLDLNEKSTIEEHDAVLRDRILSCVSKRDTLLILGDNGNTETTIALINDCAAFKVVYVPGNHDPGQHIERISAIRKVVTKGIHKYKNYWISHCPIHPRELWGRKNIHGHIHSNSLPDENYINVSVESCKGFPVTLEAIRNGEYTTHEQKHSS